MRFSISAKRTHPGNLKNANEDGVICAFSPIQVLPKQTHLLAREFDSAYKRYRWGEKVKDTYGMAHAFHKLDVKEHKTHQWMPTSRVESFTRKTGTVAIFRHCCSDSGHLAAASGLKVQPAVRRLRYAKFSRAFTLVEALIAAGLMVLFVAAAMSAILCDQVANRKAKEEAIAMDFLTKYSENIRALPFANVNTGQPINLLYNGANSTPNISIPANATWVSVNTAAYKTFYPDLLWFNNRNPQIKVTLTKNSVGGVAHDTEVNVRFDWDPPLSKGGRQEVQVDFLRTKDVTTL